MPPNVEASTPKVAARLPEPNGNGSPIGNCGPKGRDGRNKAASSGLIPRPGLTMVAPRTLSGPTIGGRMPKRTSFLYCLAGNNFQHAGKYNLLQDIEFFSTNIHIIYQFQTHECGINELLLRSLEKLRMTILYIELIVCSHKPLYKILLRK